MKMPKSHQIYGLSRPRISVCNKANRDKSAEASWQEICLEASECDRGRDGPG